MSIPTKAQFDDWVELATTPFSEGLNEDLREALRENPEQDSKALILSFVDSYIAARDSRLSALYEHPVKKWLDTQPGYTRAESLLKPRRGSRHEVVTSAHERFVHYLLEGGDSNKASARSQSLVNRTFRYTWIVGVVLALRTYLFEDHKAIFTARSKLKENIEQIEKLVREVEPYLAAISKGTVATEVVIRRVLSWSRYVDGRAPRNQKTNAELAFVADMYRVNRLILRSAKPPVIAELMTLECFQRPFDERHIARLCSQLEQTRRESDALKSVMTVHPY